MKSKLATLLMLCSSVAEAGSPYCRTCYPTNYVQPVTSYVAPTTQVFAVTNVYPQPLVPPGTTQTVGTGYSVIAASFIDKDRFLSDQNLLTRAALESNQAANASVINAFVRLSELEQPAKDRTVAADGAERVLRAAGLDGVYNTTASQPNPPLAAQQTTMLIQRDAAGKLYLTPVTAAQMAQLQARQNPAPMPPPEVPAENPPVAAPAPGTFKAVPPLPPPACAMPGPTVTPPAPAPNVSSSSPYPTEMRFCSKCHGIAAKEPKGGVLLDATAKDLEANYYRIRKNISDGHMPPKGSEQPTNQEREAIMLDIARMIGSTHK